MYQALYRAYRPEVFSEILGQEHIVRILRNQIKKGETGHAYLLCGTRGTGKTTTARILAKAVNCLSDGDKPCGTCANCQAIKNGTFMDVVEIDAASNNGVENIRDLRESVQYPPVLGRKKVYIIDEVHMLSTGACNALLKTLEEPPEYCMFILATTEPQKLLPTILSRCIRLDFRRVPEYTIKEGMRRICSDRGISVTEDALGLIAVNADGSVRDGLSILDQCLAGVQDSLTRDDVIDFLGIPSEEALIELTHNVAVHNISDALIILDELIRDGKEIKQLMKEWLEHYRSLLIARFIKSPEDMLNMSSENVSRIRAQAQALEPEEINRGIRELSATINEARWSTQPRVLLELCIVKLGSFYEERQPAARQIGKVMPEAAAVKKDECETEPAEDFSRLWDDAVNRAASMKPGLTMLAGHTRITGMDEGTFTVEPSSPAMENMLKTSRQLIEEIIEKLTGRKLSMVCGQGDGGSSNAESIAGKIENAFNINVEIK